MLHDTTYIVMRCSAPDDATEMSEQMFVFSSNFSTWDVFMALYENEWDGSYHELISAGHLSVSRYGISVSGIRDRAMSGYPCRPVEDVELAKKLFDV